VSELTIATLGCLGIIAYHYIGYPLLLATAAALRPNPVRRDTEYPSVSLIISAYNEDVVIEEKLRNTLKLQYPRELLQIIVVTDGSTDTTPELVERYHGHEVVLLHKAERRGKSAAINRGAELASGDILVLSDANALYEPDALARLVSNFADQHVAAVSGCKKVRRTEAMVTESEGFYWRYESLIKKLESRLDSTVAVVGEMFAIRRKLFRPIPDDIINDDSYLMLSALNNGMRVIYEDRAVCSELGAQSVNSELVRRERIMAGRLQIIFRRQLWLRLRPLVAFQFFSHKVLRPFLGVFMGAALFANFAAVVVESNVTWLLILLLAQCCCYLLAILGWIAERTASRWRLPALAYYVIGSNLRSFNALRKYASGQQTVLWEKLPR